MKPTDWPQTSFIFDNYLSLAARMGATSVRTVLGRRRLLQTGRKLNFSLNRLAETPISPPPALEKGCLQHAKLLPSSTAWKRNHSVSPHPEITSARKASGNLDLRRAKAAFSESLLNLTNPSRRNQGNRLIGLTKNLFDVYSGLWSDNLVC
jgi:hypothetical protein